MSDGFVVIVPVFNAADEVRQTLDSLLRALTPPHTALIVDDASTDPMIAGLLTDLARAAPHRVTLVQQRVNQGFTGSVNRALRERDGRDVVLLNSDTRLTRSALTRLRRCLDSDRRVATATPFSNNAEICSIPLFCQSNPLPVDCEPWAMACADAGDPTYPELPTGVGFCMAIRSGALDALGDFDAATFGRGYGEENDFCRRAAGLGWRNVLCDDAFVGHTGSASFAATGEGPGGVNAARLHARYPHYPALVAEFIARDPLKVRRDAIIARLHDGARERPPT